MLSYLIHNKWKTLIILLAFAIAGLSMWYTNNLVNKLKQEERQKIEIWAEANREILETPLDGEISLYLFKIISENKTIPRILVDNAGNISNSMNIEFNEANKDEILQEKLKEMKEATEPIEIYLSENKKNYIYYKDSLLLEELRYYPFFQLFILLLFLSGVYFALTTYRTAENNKLWVGMSKETAHQLGTPISSLLAWVELLKSREGNNTLVNEVSKDVTRLEKITERFSRIGSAPKLTDTNITKVLITALDYLETRSSSRISFNLEFSENTEVIAPINTELFEWVIENLWKNALDAMNNAGEISVSLHENNTSVFLEFEDTGKGIPKSKFKTIFKPGFTTKARGWGLGLSLTRRIINDYHKGKIFIKSSEIGIGTCFKIILRKKISDK